MPAARSDCGDPFGRRRVDGDDRVVRSQPRAVGQRDLHPGSEVRRLLRVERGRLEAVGLAADEADSELEEVAVPVVEPRFGGGTVEHAVGLVVAAIHLQLELKIGGEIGAGIAPARVERGQYPGHFQQERVEAWRVGEPAGSVVASRPTKKS